MSNFRSKAFNPVSKKIEDAEYCDDYYGRHRYGIRFDDGCVHPEAQCGIDAAATAIDSLLKERDAQAVLVQKLQRALMCWMPGVSEATETETNGRCGDDAQLLAGYEGEFPSECWGDKAVAKADSLQARVKELEDEIQRRNFIRAMTGPDLHDKAETWHAQATEFANRADEAESRATRLQQERDEAYERAAESQRALWFVLDANDGFTLEPADMESYPGDDRAEIVTTRNNCDGSISLKAAIRRLAGPEKEGK